MKNFLFILCALLAGQASALKPERAYRMTPEAFGISYRTEIITTPDQAKLKSWILAPAGTDLKTTIIIANGDAGNMSYLLVQAVSLSQQGFTVLMFDYRGFGESSDFKINNDFLYYNEFATDAATVIAWSRKNLKNSRTGVLAFSMGTIMCTLAAPKQPLDFFIGDGFVSSPLLAKSRLQSKKAEVILPAGAENYEKTLASLKVKMLLFGGTQDAITTNEDAKAIVAKRQGSKLVTYEGNHLQGFSLMPPGGHGEAYIQHIVEFVAGLKK